MNTDWNNQQQEAADLDTTQVARLQKKSSKRIGMYVALFIALALALAGAGILYRNYVTDNQTCTVGLSGVATNITFKGSHVDDLCKSIEDAPSTSGGARSYALD